MKNIMHNRLRGLVAAAFTPMNEDCSLNVARIGPIVEYLVSCGISGLYVCGSTGEGPLLSSRERRTIAESYVKAAKGRVPVIIHVGHESLAEARMLAEHASKIGADAIAAIPPSFFEVDSVQTLVACMGQIASAAPEMPFFYYHIPARTGADLDMLEFLRRCATSVPNFAGIKYSKLAVSEFQECVESAKDRFSILFGCDEMLTSGLSAGAVGAVGSTFNFAAPLYHRVIKAFESGRIKEARKWQSLSAAMVRILNGYRSQPAFKATMKLIGYDCGPSRLPLVTLSTDELGSLKQKLEEIGFFEWSRPDSAEAKIRLVEIRRDSQAGRKADLFVRDRTDR